MDVATLTTFGLGPGGGTIPGPPMQIGSATLENVADWVNQAVGQACVGVRVLVPDAAGRLVPAVTRGTGLPSGRAASAQRRRAFRETLATTVPGTDRSDHDVALIPIAGTVAAMGLLEVVAPGPVLEERHDRLRDVAVRSAAAMASAHERARTERAVLALKTQVTMASEMLRVEGPATAVRVATELCFRVVRCPIAGIIPDRSGKGWYVAAAAGCGGTKRARLVRAARPIAVRGRRRAALEEMSGRLAQIVGRGPIEIVEAGEAALLVVSPPPDSRMFVLGMASMLATALSHVATLGWAQVRLRSLDLGIAWTAHEIMDPLQGARKALDQVLRDDGASRNRTLLRRTRRELDQLAELIVPLLEWSTGSTTLRRRRIDLCKVVREAIDSAALVEGGGRLVLVAPRGLMVRADVQHLRGAVANLLRNALAYSPPENPVKVTVRRTAQDVARVCVRDRGPGVSPEERHLIFDPFARGGLGRSARAGRGLGLFIARRVVEAHGGSLTLRSGTSGSTFCIDLPAEAA